MTEQAHDTLVRRLAGILIKLNAGEVLSPPALAAEFGVTLRTIQRDLNDRLSYLHMERDEGRYWLHPAQLGKLSARDLDRFASLVGIKGMFPSLDADFLRGLIASTAAHPAWLVKGRALEDIGTRTTDFRLIEQAILSRVIISFRYAKGAEHKVQEDVAPYKLVHHNGTWYVAAVHTGRLKTYSLGRVSHLLVSEQRFEHDETVMAHITGSDGIWMVDEPRGQARLLINAEAAPFFQRKNLLPDQHVEAEAPDGTIVVTTSYGHPTEVAAIVKYWMPHVIVQEPAELRALVLQDVRRYLALNDERPNGGADRSSLSHQAA